MSTCPDNELLELLLADGLSDAEACRVREHIDGCHKCVERLRAFADEVQLGEEIRDVARRISLDMAHQSEAPLMGEKSPPEIAAIIPGYQFLRKIRRGGQGTVYEAIQESTRRHVAIKILDRGGAEESAIRRRFEREVELAARLRHPAIVTVHDSGICDGRMYIVMDYIEGMRLDEFVETGGLSTDGKIELMQQIVEAITHAHQHGIIHRDLKPSNILVDDKGKPHVLDFGLAKLANEGASPDRTEISLEGQMLGTLAYMSPEHISGKPAEIEVRSDVYALGVLLFQILTRKFPYDVDGSLTHVMRGIAESEPKRPSTLDRTADKDIETIVLKCLEKDKDRRYQTADALAADLRSYREGEPIEARRDSNWYVLGKTLKRHWIPASVAAAFVILISSALVAMTVLRSKAEWQSYLGNIAAADSAIKLHDPVAAKNRLDVILQSHHDWAWRYLESRLDDSLAIIGKHNGAVNSVDFSGNGEFLASGGGDRIARVWRVRTSELICAYGGLARDCRAVAYHPHHNLVASGDINGSVHVWCPKTGGVSLTLGHDLEPCRQICWSAGGDRFAVGLTSGRVVVYAFPSGELLFDHHTNDWDVSGIAFAENSDYLFTSGVDGKLGEWNLVTKTFTNLIDAHSEAVEQLAISTDRRTLVTVGKDLRARAWSAGALACESTLRDLDSIPCAVSINPANGEIAFGGRDAHVRFWQPGRPTFGRLLHGHGNIISSVAHSPDGSLIATGSNDGTVRLWRSSDWDRDEVLARHANSVEAVAVCPDGQMIATASKDCTAKILDVKTGDILATLPHKFSVVRVAFLPDGQRVVTGDSEGVIRIWKVAIGECCGTYCGRPWALQSVFPDPSGERILIASADGKIQIISSDGDFITSLSTTHPGTLQAAALCTAANAVVSGDNEGIIEVRGLSAGNLIRKPLRAHDEAIHHIAINRRANLVATASHDCTIKLWSLPDWALLRTFKGHAGSVDCVAFDEAGAKLVSGCTDGTVKLWDVATAAEILTLKGHLAGVTDVAFLSQDGDIASCSTDGTVRVWRPRPFVAVGEWIDEYQVERKARELVGVLGTAAASQLVGDPTAAGSDVRRALTRLIHEDQNETRRNAIELENDAWNTVRFPDRTAAQYETALVQAREACKLDENWITLKTYAAALYRTGRFAEAVEQYRRCDAMREGCKPSYISDLPIYALACWHIGQADNSIRILNQSQAIEGLKWPGGDERVIGPLIQEASLLIEGNSTQTASQDR